MRELRQVRIADESDYPAIRDLLNSADSVIVPEKLVDTTWAVVEIGEGIIACGGIVFEKNHAILRGFVVGEQYRRRGCARLLCAHLICEARLRGIKRVIGFTDKWQPFARKGFKVDEYQLDMLPDQVKALPTFKQMRRVEIV